ncbi:hypothetical protein Tco_1279591, partial [Tanacetum coccineum]
MTKAIKTRASKSSQRRVNECIKGVRGLLKYFITRLDKNDINLHELVDLIKDLVILLDSAAASTIVAPEGDKKSTQENKDSDIPDPTPAQGEPQPNEMPTKQPTTDEEIANAQGEQVSEQAPPIGVQVPLVSTAMVV